MRVIVVKMFFGFALMINRFRVKEIVFCLVYWVRSVGMRERLEC